MPRRVAILQVAALLVAVGAAVVAGLIFWVAWVWWIDGLPGRTSFGAWEGIPFLLIAVLFSDAAYHLLRVRLHGWWIALAGSLLALGHGVYRSFVSVAYIPGQATGTPWVSSVPGAWATFLIGCLLLPFLVWCYRPFRNIAWHKSLSGS